MIHIKKILFPTDFSPCAQHALAYAKEFAQAYQATIYCLHCIEFGQYSCGYELGTHYVGLENNALKYAEARMEELILNIKDEGLRCQSKVTSDSAFASIIDTAQKENVDLIIMGTHGHSAIQNFFTGSTTEKTVRKAPCPVLTIKDKEHEFIDDVPLASTTG